MLERRHVGRVVCIEGPAPQGRCRSNLLLACRRTMAFQWESSPRFGGRWHAGSTPCGRLPCRPGPAASAEISTLLAADLLIAIPKAYTTWQGRRVTDLRLWQAATPSPPHLCEFGPTTDTGSRNPILLLAFDRLVRFDWSPSEFIRHSPLEPGTNTTSFRLWRTFWGSCVSGDGDDRRVGWKSEDKQRS